MSRKTLLAIVAGCLVSAASNAAAYETGDWVVVVRACKIEIDTGPVENVEVGQCFRVKKVKDDWLWVGSGRPGWIDEANVMDPAQALDHFTERIQQNADDADAYFGRAGLRQAMGDSNRALRDIDEALRLAPSARAYSRRGLIWMGRGRIDSSIADLTSALRLDPKYISAYDNRGEAWSRKGVYDKAIADYKTALRLDPKDFSSCNNLAWLLATCPQEKYRNGKLAIEYAKKTCELTHWKDEVWFDTLAAAYAEAGDFKEALKWQTKATADPPEVYRAQFRERLRFTNWANPIAMIPRSNSCCGLMKMKSNLPTCSAARRSPRRQSLECGG